MRSEPLPRHEAMAARLSAAETPPSTDRMDKHGCRAMPGSAAPALPVPVNAARVQAAILLALMHELQGVMQTENALLHALRLDRLRTLQDERLALAADYHAALHRLRLAPETLQAMDEGDRAELDGSIRQLQAAVRHHAEQLLQARAAAAEVISIIDASLAGTNPGADVFAARQSAGEARRRLIAPAFERPLLVQHGAV